MARREEMITISADGRDKGKLFHLIEMPATQGEDIALRIFLALAKSGVDVPQEVQDAGLVGLAAWGIRSLAGVPFAEAKQIKDEIFTSCVQFVPDAARPNMRRGKGTFCVGPMVEEDIEEISTRWFLYQKIVYMHTGFFADAAESNFPVGSGPTASTTGPSTRTSRAPSVQ